MPVPNWTQPTEQSYPTTKYIPVKMAISKKNAPSKERIIALAEAALAEAETNEAANPKEGATRYVALSA